MSAGVLQSEDAGSIRRTTSAWIEPFNDYTAKRRTSAPPSIFAPGGNNRGRWWLGREYGKIVQSKAEVSWSGVSRCRWRGLRRRAQRRRCDDINKELFKFKTPSGIMAGRFITRTARTWCLLGHRRLGRLGMAAGLEGPEGQRRGAAKNA
jgi:hypothetical protein